MTCPDENQLIAFVENRLTEVERAVLEAHLDTCPGCLAVTCGAAREADFLADTIEVEPPRSSAPVSLRPGARVGRYTVERLLGQGAMGSVYAAHDPQLDRRIALKVVRADRLKHEGARERLAREARAMA